MNFTGQLQYGLAFLSEDPRELRLFQGLQWSFDDLGTGTGRPTREWAINRDSNILSLAVGTVESLSAELPFWVERSTDGGTHLYFAEWPLDEEPVVHEIAYPFSDAVEPRIRTSTRSGRILVTDTSATGEFLLATIKVNSPTELASSTRTVAAPGVQRGELFESYSTPPDSTEWTQQVVQFFNDTNTFVAFHIDDAQEAVEIGRGQWPMGAVAGHVWTGLLPGCMPRPLNDERWPTPFAILDRAGERQAGAANVWIYSEYVLL